MKMASNMSLCSVDLFQATLKKYQGERRSKSESIERCQSQLKKLRRKSQGSRHPNKYGDREMQVKPKKGVNTRRAVRKRIAAILE